MGSNIIDFVSKRKEKIEKKRRNFERILFQDFLGASFVLDEGEETRPVSLIDISRDGCLFQIPHERGERGRKSLFKVGAVVTLRMYFSQSGHIPVSLEIKRTDDVIGEGGRHYRQYGGEFDKSTGSFVALSVFIDFLYKFAEYAHMDGEEQRVYWGQ